MWYLLLPLFLIACAVPTPAGRAAPDSAVVHEEKQEPRLVVEPKVKKIVAQHPLPPCDVTQDAGRRQILDTMDCILQETK
jgi:hypothetical protein